MGHISGTVIDSNVDAKHHVVVVYVNYCTSYFKTLHYRFRDVFNAHRVVFSDRYLERSFTRYWGYIIVIISVERNVEADVRDFITGSTIERVISYNLNYFITHSVPVFYSTFISDIVVEVRQNII